ncbi:olfactory receptor 2A12-like [Rana temporaria]|uniref:olfactory receptor 2A12-like n=1 Tax=Rana temporaria TaxID=8407 RepID=UPI001AADFE66|nr:olfactory receptor 2A12-like [Rana temporaria]
MGIHGGLQHTQEDDHYNTNLYIPRINSEENSAKVSRQWNETIIVDVLVVGFDWFTDYRIPLFLLLLIIYTVTCIVNFLIIYLVCKNPRLHSPMYFLISNLFICDLVGTTSIGPSAMQIILWGRIVVPYVDCVFQMNVVNVVQFTQTFLLTLMSYDRYLAICHPLRYSALIHNRLCLYLVIVLWLFSLSLVAVYFYYLMSLKFCAPIIMNYFFCEYSALPFPVCDRADIGPLVIYGFVIAYVLNLPFGLVVLSYILIIISILRIKSSAGRRKAFSTCSSHLLVVSLFFGIPFALITLDLCGTMSESIYSGFTFIFYLVLPMLNPIIYTSRNRDIHKALTASRWVDVHVRPPVLVVISD